MIFMSNELNHVFTLSSEILKCNNRSLGLFTVWSVKDIISLHIFIKIFCHLNMTKLVGAFRPKELLHCIPNCYMVLVAREISVPAWIEPGYIFRIESCFIDAKVTIV